MEGIVPGREWAFIIWLFLFVGLPCSLVFLLSWLLNRTEKELERTVKELKGVKVALRTTRKQLEIEAERTDQYRTRLRKARATAKHYKAEAEHYSRLYDVERDWNRELTKPRSIRVRNRGQLPPLPPRSPKEKAQLELVQRWLEAEAKNVLQQEFANQNQIGLRTLQRYLQIWRDRGMI
jgi:hypothetical protein